VGVWRDQCLDRDRRDVAGIDDADGTTSKADVVEWISEVYAREDGKWLCILSQKTPAG
jgi:hypothetical protein